MYMNLREIILNFYMWMSWTVRLSPNLAYGPDFVKRLRKKTDITLDCHLMVDRAEDKLDWFDFQPGEHVSLHYEGNLSYPELPRSSCKESG